MFSIVDCRMMRNHVMCGVTSCDVVSHHITIDYTTGVLGRVCTVGEPDNIPGYNPPRDIIHQGVCSTYIAPSPDSIPVSTLLNVKTLADARGLSGSI